MSNHSVGTVEIRFRPDKAVRKQVCEPLVIGALAYFEDPANWADFETWHIKRYGRPPSKKSYGHPDERKEKKRW